MNAFSPETLKLLQSVLDEAWESSEAGRTSADK